MPSELLGPFALTAALLVTVGVLWRDHLRGDKDDRDQRDKALDIAHAQVEASNREADQSSAATRELARIADGYAAISTELRGIRKDMAARRRNE